MATAKPSRSGRPSRRAAAKPIAADQRRRERISRAQVEQLQAKASQQRVEKLAQQILRKQLKADEQALAQALAKQRYQDLGGAGEGVGTPEQRAAALPQQRKAQQKQRAQQVAAKATPKAAAKAKPKGKKG